MRLLVISQYGQGLGLASHLSSEGHSVSFVIETGSAIGNGVLSSSCDAIPDITIFDSESFGKSADETRELGQRVIGPSRWSQMLEQDADYAKGVISSLGWDTETVNNGINLYITAWFNGANYLATYSSLVYRRFMSGGRGPDVNFTGVVSNFERPSERVSAEYLKPLETLLRRANHRGCFHAHLLVDNQRVSIKEISASFNHPLVLPLFENSKLAKGDILLRLLNEDSQRIAPLEDWAAGVLISVPPYPYEVDFGRFRLKGIQPANLKHLWLVDVLRDNDEWQTAGDSGKVGYVTARGSTVSEAVRRVYRTIGNLEIRDLQYRDDVGRNVQSLLATLRNNGWIR